MNRLLILLFTFSFHSSFAQQILDSCISGNCSDGYGVYIDENGAKYSGNFKNKMKDGKGKMEWPNGTVYEGDFALGHMLGKGIIHYPNGEVYEGEVVGGKRNGKGKNKWPNGTTYDGEWVMNHMEGQGTIKYPSGSWYVGTLKASKRSGAGTHFNPDGTVFYSGQWLDDVQVPVGTDQGSTRKVLPPSFCMAFKEVMRDLDNNLKNTLGPKEKEAGNNKEETYYVPKLHLPDALYNTIHSTSLANTYLSHLGEYPSQKDAEAGMEYKIQEIRACMDTSKYYLVESATPSTNIKTVKLYMAGKKTEKGFESPRMHISISREEKIYTLVLYLFGGKTTEYFYIREDTVSTPGEVLARDLKTIMKAAENNFKDLLPDSIPKKDGKKIDIPSSLSLPGATDCRILTRADVKYKGHTCSMYTGKSEALARKIYEELFLQLNLILGPEFVYNHEDFWKASVSSTEFSKYNQFSPKIKIALYKQPDGTCEVALMVYQE